MRSFLFLLLLAACGGGTRTPPPSPNLAQRLVDAARAGDSSQVAALLANGVSPDTLAPDGTRPLLEAARDGRVSVVRALLAADATVGVKDSVGYTAWDYVIENGHPDIGALLTRRVAILAGAGEESTAWFDAVAAGRPPPVWHQVLDGELESLGLLYAVLLDRESVVEAMRHGAGIPNRTGLTALGMAARFGNQAAVRVLLQAGANADLAMHDRWESTPLMEAARDGHLEVGRMLLDAGARVDHRDLPGGTALHWAVRAGETAYAKLLLQHAADRTIAEWGGDRPIDIAQRNNHDALIALLSGRR